MQLTIALERYDRHVAFFNGTVPPIEGIELAALEVGESAVKRDGTDRHHRMLHGLEFDIAEVSLASYIMAIAREPDLPIIALPIFPRRLFSQSQMYVSGRARIEKPADLIGKKVGVHAFQVTLSVLAKGDLKLEYGVPWEKMSWVCMNAENQPLTFAADVSVTRVPAGSEIGRMLIEGEIDALFSPQPRPSMLAAPGSYRRLFPDAKAEETRYFRKFGFWPIMHLMAVKREAVRKAPHLPRALMAACEAAKRLAYDFYCDSNYSVLAWARGAYEEQRSVLGEDPWPNGLAANRKNLEQFIGYCVDQRLIGRPIPVERMFEPTTHAS